jgi:hypothetical protein
MVLWLLPPVPSPTISAMLVLLDQLNPRDLDPFRCLIQHLLFCLTAASEQQRQESLRLVDT